jgi:hypothetical protein
MEVLDWEFSREYKSRSLLCVSSCSLGQEFGVHNNSLINLGRALHERVFKVKDDYGNLVDPPRPTVKMPICGSFQSQWIKFLEPCRLSSYQDVVRSYKGRKASRYSSALESLENCPLMEEDSHLTAFLKAEKTNLSMKQDPAPRLIQFPKPRYSLELMRYLKHNEKKFMRAIDDVWGAKTVMSSYNCQQLGVILEEKWNQFDKPVAVPLDFSRFDQHCSREALLYEFEFYKMAFVYDDYLSWLLDMQLHPKGIAVARDGAIRYECPQGGRGSGQINTSMGNKLIVCGLMYEYFQEIGLSASLANMGDDCVIFLDENDLSLLDSTLSSWWLARGYNAIVEEVCYELESIEFCQSNPVLVNGSYQMVRNPLKSITKDCCTLQSSETVAQIASTYMAVSTCGRIINSGVPIMYSLHNSLFRASSIYTKKIDLSDEFIYKVVEFGNYERMRGLTYIRRSIQSDTRLSFYKAFGITPETQVILESYYDSLDLDFAQGVEHVNSIEFYAALHPILIENTLGIY